MATSAELDRIVIKMVAAWSRVRINGVHSSKKNISDVWTARQLDCSRYVGETRRGKQIADLLREFLTETSESLETIDNQLVKFEQEPNNAKILDNIFRLVHTIKGTCGFLGLPRLEALAHAGETLMDKFRDGLPVTAGAVTLILSSIDRIKEILAGLEATEAEPEGTDHDLISQLEEMVERGMAAMAEEAAPAVPAQVEVPAAAVTNPRHADRPDPGTAAASGRGVARRARTRLPRDRDRGQDGARS
jgi:two-component system, chemotaxis family, sensor kinase CheA